VTKVYFIVLRWDAKEGNGYDCDPFDAIDRQSYILFIVKLHSFR